MVWQKKTPYQLTALQHHQCSAAVGKGFDSQDYILRRDHSQGTQVYICTPRDNLPLRDDLLWGSYHGQGAQVTIAESQQEHKQDSEGIIVEDNRRDMVASLPIIAEQEERDKDQSQQRRNEHHKPILTNLDEGHNHLIHYVVRSLSIFNN